jgi:hypothetical protein
VSAINTTSTQHWYYHCNERWRAILNVFNRLQAQLLDSQGGAAGASAMTTALANLQREIKVTCHMEGIGFI